MTLANRITLVRLALIPVFLALVVSYDRGQWGVRWLALAAFAAAGLTDALDGYVARAYDQRTRLGAVLDPLADKLLLNLTFVFLAVNEAFAVTVPQWVPVVILGRDVIVVVGAYALKEYAGSLDVRPRLLGKLTTVLQISAILAVLLELPVAHAVLMAAVGATLLSLADYVYVGLRHLGAARAVS